MVGMERACNLGVRDLEIQTDSQRTVKLLSYEKTPDHQHATLVAKYHWLLDMNWLVSLKHIFREANHLADALADKGYGTNLGTHTNGHTNTVIRYWERYDLSGVLGVVCIRDLGLGFWVIWGQNPFPRDFVICNVNVIFSF
ncbi:Putative ribonuclease H protein At1g65750 [Linum perenne]